MAQKSLGEDLAEIVGASNVVLDHDDQAPFLREPRKRFQKPAAAIVHPRNVGDLQRLVQWANETKTSLVPQSGNTGLVGGQVPFHGDEIIVSMKHFTNVLDMNAEAGHMSVEAGVSLLDAQKAAENAGALFPLSLASEGSALIGGVLSSNAGGVQVLAYGNARELCLGIDVVLPNGELLKGLNSLRKNNTGYDLKNLFVGAEGTLGFITAATLKLFPAPEAYETAFVNVNSPSEAFELFALARSIAGGTLTAFELMPRFGVDMQLHHKMIDSDPAVEPSDWHVLLEISRPKGGAEGSLMTILEKAFELGLVSNAALAQSLTERDAQWRAREQMSEAQSREGGSIKHDVSVPLAEIPALIERGSAVAQKVMPGLRPCPFGHMGDGNLHFNFSQPVGMDKAAFMAAVQPVHDAVYEVVLELGGSVSAEHGIGQLKTELLREVKDPVAYSVMRQIKAVLDSNGIMNPGKMFPAEN